MRDFLGNSMYRLLGSTADVSWLCSNGVPEVSELAEDEIDDDNNMEEKAQWRRKTRESAARSKTGLWGPTHSFSSDECDGFSFQEEKKFEIDVLVTPVAKTCSASNSHPGTNSTKSTHGSSPAKEEQKSSSSSDNDGLVEPIPCTLGKVWSNLQCLEGGTSKGIVPEKNSTKGSGQMQENNRIMDMIDEVCTPCRPRNLEASLSSYDHDEASLGISRLAPPNACLHPFSTRQRSSRVNKTAIEQSPSTDAKSTTTTETPADRRRERHKRRQRASVKHGNDGSDSCTGQEAYEVTPDQVVLVQKEQTLSSVQLRNRPLPVESLELNKQTAVELERCISELTMRSSYGEATAKIAENRRMAYYAVGRHHRQSGRGGNRRCYFTGKLILGGAPFYAGSVQQGLRTLVVFCLPSAVGLPREIPRNSSPSSRAPLVSVSSHRRPSLSSRSNASAAHSLGMNGYPKSTASLLSRKSSKLSRLSSVDDMSLSVEEELDPNWELDKEYLLSVLPEPTQDLLDDMASRYPAQFETLPVQVRSPHCWKLYVKFCFFSGLPIAEGEMHYKVRDSVANQYGEEIILSHEVMEAVNGESAEILRLPNLKTFRYLKKHYHQQSAKLPDSCFQRQAWEMVRPEV
eukprot:CAMPEP_0178738578 /NCGR_PEP_ID=MMETSP0744-20121128/3591_1 /TAXON_ID=913974 /ORGANISM="Nitzschia punctata, Strain CCMP561" /LENGTH=628 /DNA_ID=CAMNT_0020391213 /DNA_START=40 /DNA_END=1926 /DNA_ORIENTATION=-